jgi:hypothetical protein
MVKPDVPIHEGGYILSEREKKYSPWPYYYYNIKYYICKWVI